MPKSIAAVCARRGRILSMLCLLATQTALADELTHQALLESVRGCLPSELGTCPADIEAALGAPQNGADGPALSLCVSIADFHRLWPSAQQAMAQIDACTEPLIQTAGAAASVRTHVIDLQGRAVPLGALDGAGQTIPDKTAERTTMPLSTRGAEAPGALADASIFLSAGHGWYWSDVLERWATQRGNNNLMVEDHSNSEAMYQYLVPLLEAAGARVYTTRERDVRSEAALVDDSDPSVVITGDWNVQASASAYAGQQRVHAGGPVDAAHVFWPFQPAQDGPADVYLWHSIAAAETDVSPVVEIFHAGGVSERLLDQRLDGSTWRHLGRFQFRAGPTVQGVRLRAPDGAASINWVADAVRFGGGQGDMVDPLSGTSSGWPRWEESGRYHAGFLGYPNWTANNTVNALPRWAAWEHESWESGRSVYVAWHTNAADSDTARGTSSYAYSSSGFQGPFTGVPGGLELRNAIQARLVEAIRALWDPAWTDRGNYTNWFGEVNPNHNPEMPASLHEIGFHTSPDDAQALLDPRFRRIAARAMYQGIQIWFNENVAGYDIDTFLPEPPTHLAVSCTPDGNATIRWQPAPVRADRLTGDAASGFRVYRSSDARGFALYLESASAQSQWLDLPLYQPSWFRVTAVNAAGESLPSETLGCVPSPVGPENRVLVVSGFDRFERSLNELVDDPYSSNARSLGLTERLNTRDYVEQYLPGLAALGVAVDSLSNEALIDDADVGDYAAVVWILGEESVNDRTLDSTERALLETHLAGGGHLLISGSELVWELVQLGVAPGFASATLGVGYAGDDSGSNQVLGSSGGVFDGLAFGFGGAAARYPVEWPDALQTTAGSQAVLEYANAAIAGVLFEPGGAAGARLTLGFPIESIEDEAQRRELFRRLFERWNLVPDDTIFADDFDLD